MSLSQKQIRKIIREELKNIKNIQKVIPHPAFRKSKCTVYLKESNGKMKTVSFNSLRKQQRKGVFSEQQVHDILKSSFDHDMRMFNRYSAAYTNLSQHMISEGLIAENGKITKKGRLLERKERGVVLVESDMRKYAASLILEQEEEEEIDVQSIKTTGQKVFGAIGKGLKKVGSFLMTPFKAWKWFKDKVWEVVSGLFAKIGQMISAFAQKYNLEWLQNTVSGIEKVIAAVKKFCDKNKWVKIMCNMVLSVALAFAIKAAIGAIMAAMGVTASGLLISAAAGTACAAGAVAGALGEGPAPKSLLKEVGASDLCNLAATAATSTTNNTLNLVKGVIKYLASEEGNLGAAAQQALEFVDKYHETLTAAGKDIGVGSGAKSKEVLENLGKAARACKTEGAQMVAKAVGFIKEYGLGLKATAGAADAHSSGAADTTSDAFLELGRVAMSDTQDNYQKLFNLAKDIQGEGWDPKTFVNSVVKMGSNLGFDSVPKWAESAAEAMKASGEISAGSFEAGEAAAEGATTFKDWMQEIGGLKNLLGPAGFEGRQAEFIEAAKAFKDSKTGEVGFMAWKAAGQPALKGAILQENFNRIQRLAGVLA